MGSVHTTIIHPPPSPVKRTPATGYDRLTGVSMSFTRLVAAGNSNANFGRILSAIEPLRMQLAC